MEKQEIVDLPANLDLALPSWYFSFLIGNLSVQSYNTPQLITIFNLRR